MMVLFDFAAKEWDTEKNMNHRKWKKKSNSTNNNRRTQINEYK